MNQIETLDVLEDELPVVHQMLDLRCLPCGQPGRYDVGHVLWDTGEGTKGEQPDFFFANYFRCQHCQSSGPWRVQSVLEMTGILLRSLVRRKSPGLSAGAARLLDGTFIQSTAMGEDHLRSLLAREPRSTFLHTRLGNLFRISGDRVRAREWYEKAVAIEPAHIEAHFHLYRFDVQAGEHPAALEHARALSRFLSGDAATQSQADEKFLDAMSDNLFALRDRFEPLLRQTAPGRSEDASLLDLLHEEAEAEAADETDPDEDTTGDAESSLRCARSSNENV
jgi:tetratricopeptide (TPR) repeat protein